MEKSRIDELELRPGEVFAAAMLITPDGRCRWRATGVVTKRALLDMMASCTEQTRLEVLCELQEANAAAKRELEAAKAAIVAPGRRF